MKFHQLDATVKPVLGNRLTAGLRSLDPPIKVRILVPQPEQKRPQGRFLFKQPLTFPKTLARLQASARRLLETDF
jgi:hypothetical protein